MHGLGRLHSSAASYPRRTCASTLHTGAGACARGLAEDLPFMHSLQRTCCGHALGGGGGRVGEGEVLSQASLLI